MLESPPDPRKARAQKGKKISGAGQRPDPEMANLIFGQASKGQADFQG
jgi:hypothetical protein